jgi:hypothetical protein
MVAFIPVHDNSYIATLKDVLGVRGPEIDLTDDDQVQIIRKLDIAAALNVFGLTQSADGEISRHAILVILHKIRVQWKFRRLFTAGEQRLSQRWLKDHGYTTKLYDKKLDAVQNPER